MAKMAFVARAGRAEESPRTSAEVSARALTQTSLQDSLRVSQNFLTSPALIRRIVRLAHFTPGDTIVEVGAGKGHLTRGLLETGAAVTAVELDGALYRGLKEKFGAQKNLRLVHADFLDWPLPRTSYKVFANIPFNRTTAIVRKLTGEAGADGSAREGQHRHTNSPRANVQAGARTSPRAGNRLPEEAWLIMEKGAAKRFLGQPRESLFSMLLKPFFDLDICYHFRREDFHPAPAVDTVLLQLKKKAAPDISIEQRGQYRRFITACFTGRGVYALLTKTQVSRALKEAGLSGNISGDTRYVQWLCLFRCYLRFGAGR